MKRLQKLFLSAVLITCLSQYAQAQNDTTVKGNYYYYYPELNVYSDQKATDYWYYDSTASNWVEAKKLPGKYKWNKQSKRNMVYYKGTDVWMDNASHQKRYVKKPPTTN